MAKQIPHLPGTLIARLRRGGRGVKRKRGKMNGAERKYDEVLNCRKLRGEIFWYAFEAITLVLAPDTRYTPDFIIMLADGTIEIHEVKGWMEEAAFVRLKVAASLFPFIFRLVKIRPKKLGGSFQITLIGDAVEISSAQVSTATHIEPLT